MAPSAMPPDLTDDEVDAITAGLRQNAARVRYIERLLGGRVKIKRKPNGRPLVPRALYVQLRGALR